MNKLRSLLSVLFVAGFVFMLGGQAQAQSLLENMEPISNAGPDQVVPPSFEVTLDGSASTDPDGNLPLTYLWTQTGGTAVVLSDATAVNPTFTAPAAADVLTFALTVTDALAMADPTPDEVIISVTNPPAADAGPDQTAGTNTLVTLDGSASTDPDGDTPLTYLWTQTGGTTVTLTGADTVNPTFTAPNAPDTLTFSLLVSDSLGMPAAAPDTVTITVDYNYVYLPIIMTPYPPEAFNKSSPANGAINQSVTPLLSWGSTSPLSHYEYCYDTTDDNACTNWSYAGKNTSVTLPALTPSTTYYWQVRAWNSPAGPTYANGSATAFWSFTTLPKPGNFNKILPTNAAVGQPLTPTLTWGAAAYATKYEYCYDTTNDNACTNWKANGLSLTVTLPTLLSNTTYYWQVRAWNSGAGPTYADGSATSFRSFKTVQFPAAFGKTAPANAATSVSLTPTLSWGATSPVTYYQYCYDTTNDNQCTTWLSNGTSTSVVLPPLTVNTTYYWHVRAYNGIGGPTYANGSATAFWSFKVTTDPLLNGGFELGHVYWEEYSNLGYYSIYNISDGIPISPRSGSWLAWMGDLLNENSAIAQTITIPVGRSVLHYWFASNSADSCGNDGFGIFMTDTLVYSESVCYTNDTNDVWVHRTLNLSSYAGTTQEIWFIVVTNGTNNSRIFLDDISFEATTSSSSSEIQSTSTMPSAADEIMDLFVVWKDRLSHLEMGAPMKSR